MQGLLKVPVSRLTCRRRSVISKCRMKSIVCQMVRPVSRAESRSQVQPSLSCRQPNSGVDFPGPGISTARPGRAPESHQIFETPGNYEAILRSIFPSYRKPPPISPDYQPRTHSSFDRSPFHLRGRETRGVRGYVVGRLRWRMPGRDARNNNPNKQPQSTRVGERTPSKRAEPTVL